MKNHSYVEGFTMGFHPRTSRRQGLNVTEVQIWAQRELVPCWGIQQVVTGSKGVYGA